MPFEALVSAMYADAIAGGAGNDMLRRWFERIVTLLRNLKQMPAIVRMAIELVEAQQDAARKDYLAAERRLVRVYRLAPAGAVARSTTNLLMAQVCLRLGNLQAAADLAPTAVAHVCSLRFFANDAERRYLRYVGRLIYEEATQRLGSPRSLEVGADYDDLDIQRVRSSLRKAYPINRPRPLDTILH